MRIVAKGKLKDYYDRISRFDADPHPTWVRDERLVEVGLEVYNPVAHNRREGGKPYRGEIGSHVCYVGFCGEVRAFEVVELTRGDGTEAPEAIVQECIPGAVLSSFTGEFVTACLELDFSGLGPEPASDKQRDPDWCMRRFAHEARGLERLGLFKKFNTPTFNLTESHRYTGNLTLNCRLGPFGFQRIVSAEQAWQRIRMFLEGELNAPRDPVMPVGGDKVVAAAHGYDKWSFRREPGV